MEVEIDDDEVEVVVEMMVVRKEFDHCQEKLQWMIDIEVQQNVDLLRRESFENHRSMSYSIS
jgi:hypothetical protein